jgi:ligand-binding SRPBCC domain-containing protein
MHHLKYTQKLPISLEDSWEFFSSPKNLSLITPEYMSFEIKKPMLESNMYPGQIIEYTIKPLFNIPITWVTEIMHVEKPYYFVDEQRFGPYQFWHHEHHFKAIPSGVEMTDLVYYKMKFGFIGDLVNHFKVKKDLEGIFSYRKTKLEAIFRIPPR